MSQQNALNKTPAELAKLSDDRLGNILGAARKEFNRKDVAVTRVSEEADRNLADANDDREVALSYFETVQKACEGRPHFHKD